MSLRTISIFYAGAALAVLASGQAAVPANPAPGAVQQPPSAPLTLTLKDALTRAQMYAPQFLSALTDANVAHEDLLQARAARRPTLSGRSEYLGTQGNGVLPSGRFVTNDGVHVYRDWAVVHQDFIAAITRTGTQRAAVNEAVFRARAEVAQRGLALTVTRAYYALLTGQRKYASAQQSLDQAKRYLDISRSLERGGEVAHSDSVRAEIQYAAQEQAYRESKLTIDNARLDLAVLLFRELDQNFTVVDDLDLTPALPPLNEIQALAARENPTIRAAMGSVSTAQFDVTLARQAFWPTLTADFVYGIEANAFALHSTVAAAPQVGKVPNLGYFLTVSLNVPVWDWGSRSSKVRQAVLKRDQLNVELTAAQRSLMRDLQGFYQEAQTAREQVDSLRHSVDLANESLRLNGLRYQAAEATILELVDAQTTVTQARNAFEDALARYRLALANLQTLTGAF
jgi:outer membrane protein TolC